MDNSPARLMFVGAFLALFSSVGQAIAFSGSDVSYVTASQDLDEIDYVVCLEAEVGKTPRNMSMRRALFNSDRICQNAGYLLPRRDFARQVRDFVLDCGFRSTDARQGSFCGLSARVPAPPVIVRCSPPEEFIGGRCRLPAGVQRCSPPEEFIGGRCRLPAGVQRCSPPEEFIGGRCRLPPMAQRCSPPEEFIGGRCRLPVGMTQCSAPEEFIGGRCRLPAGVQRCTPPKTFVGGRCR